MKQLSALFLLLVGSSLSAQTIFQRVFDCTIGDVQAIETTTSGSFVAYNIIDDVITTYRGVGIVKYGLDHQPVWSNVYTVPGTFSDLSVSDMTATADGGAAFVGMKSLSVSDTAIVVKVSSAGQVVWALGMPSFLPPGATVESFASATGVEEAPNGDLLVVGHFSYETDDFHRVGFLARISATGTVLWTKSVASSVDPDLVNYAVDVEPVTGGGLALLGYTSSDGAWLARLQDNGTVNWSKRYSTVDGFDSMGPNRVFNTSGGGFDIFLETDLYSHNMACRMRTDASGGLQGSTLYKVPVSLGVIADVMQKPDQGYAMAAIMNLVTDEGYNANAHLVVTNAAGAITLNTSFGSSEYEGAYTVAPTADGGYLVGGGAAYLNLDDHRGGTPPQPFVVKTNAQGEYTCGDAVVMTTGDTVLTSIDRTLLVAPITGWASATVTSIPWLESVTVCSVVGVEETEAPTFSVLPNPASDQLTIVPTDMNAWDHVLLDATGHIVLSVQRSIGTSQVDVSTLAPGRYVLRSTSGPALMSTAVLVVR